jgi:hypothetical protein
MRQEIDGADRQIDDGFALAISNHPDTIAE